ncbi:MAG: FHA domain-containing protein [Chloroflexota bacterium]
MSIHIRLEIKDDIEAYEYRLQEQDNATLDDTSVQTDSPPPFVMVELVKRVTLGRGEDEPRTIHSVESQSEADSQQQLADVMDAHVDLAPYHAHNRGVSRKHARLTLDDTSISVTDLGSTNGTYINNERLHPNRDYVITAGDELRLGFMTLLLTVL